MLEFIRSCTHAENCDNEADKTLDIEASNLETDDSDPNVESDCIDSPDENGENDEIDQCDTNSNSAA
jgi:hypothetical protein